MLLACQCSHTPFSPNAVAVLFPVIRFTRPSRACERATHQSLLHNYTSQATALHTTPHSVSTPSRLAPSRGRKAIPHQAHRLLIADHETGHRAVATPDGNALKQLTSESGEGHFSQTALPPPYPRRRQSRLSLSFIEYGICGCSPITAARQLNRQLFGPVLSRSSP